MSVNEIFLPRFFFDIPIFKGADYENHIDFSFWRRFRTEKTETRRKIVGSDDLPHPNLRVLDREGSNLGFFHFFFNIKPPTLFGKFLRYGKMHCFLCLHQAPSFQAFPCDAPGPCPPLIFWLKKLEFFNRINYFTKFKTHF